MPRKSEIEQKLNRQDIIATVAHLIAQKGLSSLTMRTIANHVGCSVGSLPHYFSGKDEIVTAALNWSNERILNRLNTMPLEEVTIDALIPVVISSLPLDEQSDTEWRVRLCLWDYATTNEDLLVKVEDVRQQTLNVLNRLLGHLQKRGLIVDDLPPREIGISIYHLAIGLGFNLLHQPLCEREKHVLPLISYIDYLKPNSLLKPASPNKY